MSLEYQPKIWLNPETKLLFNSKVLRPLTFKSIHITGGAA